MYRFTHIILFAVLSFLPGLSVAYGDTCQKFNTAEFFEHFNEDAFYECIAKEDGALIWRKDRDGSIPLFKAITSEIDHGYIDDFFVGHDRWQELLDVRDNDGRNAMIIAVEEAPFPETLLKLISYGGDMFAELPNEGGQLIDHAISISGNEDFVAVLRALGAIDSREELSPSISIPILHADCNKLMQPAIIETTSARQLVYCLREGGVDAEKLDKHGNSLFHVISSYGTDANLVDALLTALPEDKRQDALNQTNEDGYTPLHLAALYSETFGIISRLISRGGDPNFVPHVKRKGIIKRLFSDKPLVTKPIHLAASRTDGFAFNAMAYLLAGDADAFAQDEKGNTALHILVRTKDTFQSDVSLILEAQNWQMSLLRRKIPESENLNGATPLAYAVYKQADYWIVSELLAYGADPDAQGEDGWSPLLIFAKHGEDADTFSLLLEKSKKACDANIDGARLDAILITNLALYEAVTVNAVHTMALFKNKCPG